MFPRKFGSILPDDTTTTSLKKTQYLSTNCSQLPNILYKLASRSPEVQAMCSSESLVCNYPTVRCLLQYPQNYILDHYHRILSHCVSEKRRVMHIEKPTWCRNTRKWAQNLPKCNGAHIPDYTKSLLLTTVTSVPTILTSQYHDSEHHSMFI
jgi:hypothetical protein